MLTSVALCRVNLLSGAPAFRSQFTECSGFKAWKSVWFESEWICLSAGGLL